MTKTKKPAARPRTKKRTAARRRAEGVLAIPAGTLSLYAAYLVIFVRLLALAFHNIDLSHLA